MLDFHADRLTVAGALTELSILTPLVDGQPVSTEPNAHPVGSGGWEITWPCTGAWAGAVFGLSVAQCELPDGRTGLQLQYRVEHLPPGSLVSRFGLHFGRIGNLRAYLRSGYHSWDGSFYVEPEALRGAKVDDESMMASYAVTQLLPRTGQGSTVVGFLRHDRMQQRLRFDLNRHPITLDIETLWDEAAHRGVIESEPLIVFEHQGVEDALRLWARAVGLASPYPPRTATPRITGWCSWYNLYAAIDEVSILEHLAAARDVAREDELPLRIFQIDDGFTPEMGDWLEVKPQFPRGMKPLLDDIRAAGFTPGLWIAPFLVGNRSRLFRDHPDWVVRDRVTGGPLACMTFYGEFRWHKRSEEYYVLDVTHPEAEAYIREVFRTWRREWGCDYFKTDFMHFGMAYGPDRAVWHQSGLSRVEIWMRMARLIREEIGDAIWLGCGCPLFAPVGLVDGVRIGRDMGVSWRGERPAETLLRDQMTRNFGHGILWQADPDCILLRDRFHEFEDHEIEALAILAGLSGGVTMTSDHLGELSPERRKLWRALLGDGEMQVCDFPLLGKAPLRYRSGHHPDGTPTFFAEGDPIIVQLRRQGTAQHGGFLFLFNTSEMTVERRYALSDFGLPDDVKLSSWPSEEPQDLSAGQLRIVLPPHHGSLFSYL